MTYLLDPPIAAKEATKDRNRIIRDRILCALEDHGRPMSPSALAKATGLGICAISLAATRSPAYFTTISNGDGVVSIDRHPHLKIA